MSSIMAPQKNGILKFKACLEKIGINPFVWLPDDILNEIFRRAGQDKGKIPVKVSINKGEEYPQTLLKYKGAWRLYINTRMLKNSPERIGELLEVYMDIDTSDRTVKMHPRLSTALNENPEALAVFNQLQPSLKTEIIKYLSFLKTAESVDKNVGRAIQFLLGQGSFVGRKGIPLHIKNKK